MILLLIFLVLPRFPCFLTHSVALHRPLNTVAPVNLLRYRYCYFLPYHVSRWANAIHPALVEILRTQKNQSHFYWGTTWRGWAGTTWREPNGVHQEMWGSGYILSWDLVSWISTSPIPPANPDGFEDYQVCEWLIEGTPHYPHLHRLSPINSCVATAPIAQANRRRSGR